MQYPKSLQPLPKHARKVFEGTLFSVWQWEQQLFDGSTQIFEKVSRSPSVGVLPVTTDNKIILTVQEQPGMAEFTSLVGGVVDPGENVTQAAHRELLEEAGVTAAELELWYSVQPVTKIEWPIYLFIARGCKRVAEMQLDPGEKIELRYVTWEEFLEVIYLETFRDQEVALRILKLLRNKTQLQELKDFIFG